MQPSNSSLCLSTEAEHFQAWEVVTYARSVFLNIDLLRLMESTVRDSNGASLVSLYEDGFSKVLRESWSKSFKQGRFMQMNRLHPLMTDDVLEKRLSKTVNDLSVEDLPHTQLPVLLNRLADIFLCEGNDGSIRVRTRLFEPWQSLILVVPPLLITSAWMAKRLNWSAGEPLDYREQKEALERLQRWLCDSTLPVDDDPFLDHLCRTQGLDETHLHLNGTTEAEKVWCDALARPASVVGGLSHKILEREYGLHVEIGNGVDRLLRQEDPELKPAMLMRRVEDAIALKALLLRRATEGPKARLAQAMDESAVTALRNAREQCLPNSNGRLSDIVIEAWQLVTLLTGFNRHTLPESLGCAFWHYALVRSQFCRLLVQQEQHKGFDQFQYITHNELREATEKDYAERFRQLERGHQQTMDFLEGRFAPKDHPDKTAALIGKILRGYLQFLGEDVSGKSLSKPDPYCSLSELLAQVQNLEKGHANAPKSLRRLRLGLVPHFIKTTKPSERDAFFSDKGVRPLCRDVRVRRETDQNARALVALLQRTRGLDSLIRGIDAASNERHAGPEVFAPVFRRMRTAGIRRFTYHVGEDYAHLASGLRAIGETVLYLGLDAGCRIGHGTAAGVSPKKWWDSVQGYVVLPIEERLDDLVFAWDTLLHARVHTDSLPLIEAEIRSLAMRIWQNPTITPDVLAAAWKLRSLDPLAREDHINDVDPNRREEAKRYAEAAERHPMAHTQFLRRHGVGVETGQLKRCREDIVISRESDVLSPKVLRALQQAVLKRLAECTIAIETLPSSNVRISIHEGYDDHHARNWLGLGKHPMQSSVAVVVGSDNPGIFATGVRQEYAHLLRMLQVRTKGLDPSHAQALIERLCTDAKRYRF
ncbi:amidohydrolase family protein [Pseudomonas lijiangensis]|uniref:Adenosine deaminase n=1 Tax=Pseudomonas lijiangensis TaxID=2995658 RepID=A0ABX8HKY2_9PSED|nr:adenosine deaminase [Pseudomonas lijiangensis]MBX8498557.1 adenosine deaminase [Pseudomonas lijiangensis]MBX8503464.1 adenosine deaminase [Pseudomonas lijiangensis]QWU80948.1 adenosine deaminase [Pseudomonas lijiangensis]